MKTQEKIQLVERHYLQPSQLGMIFLVMLASFAIGSIPLLLGANFFTANNVVPAEAQLWQGVRK